MILLAQREHQEIPSDLKRKKRFFETWKNQMQAIFRRQAPLSGADLEPQVESASGRRVRGREFRVLFSRTSRQHLRQT
jgi:hypothetical protein